MAYNNLTSNEIDNIIKVLTSTKFTGFVKELELEKSWRYFFPASSYISHKAISGFEEFAKSMRTIAGTSVKGVLTRQTDLPTVEIKHNSAKKSATLYKHALEVTFDELKAYENVWTALEQETSFDAVYGQLTELANKDLLAIKTNAAVEIYEREMERLFYHGDGSNNENAVGLLNNPDVKVIKDINNEDFINGQPTTPYTTLQAAFRRILKESNALIRPLQVSVSPTFYNVISTYMDDYGNTDIEKLLRTPVTSTAKGEPKTLQIRTLDVLETTITNENPYGDIFFIDNEHPEMYELNFRELEMYPLAQESYGYRGEFSFIYSDPFITAPYAITKLQVGKDLVKPLANQYTNSAAAAKSTKAK